MNNWIPVSERLPKDDSPILIYIVYTEYGRYGLDRYLHIGNGWRYMGEKITHWQEIEPPEAE